MATSEAVEKLLRLLGLAHRAGKLAIGATAVESLVRRGARPLVVIARDAGEAQRTRWARLSPVRGCLTDVVGRDELARALGRQELVVVALSDRDFLAGINRLGLGGYAADH